MKVLCATMSQVVAPYTMCPFKFAAARSFWVGHSVSFPSFVCLGYDKVVGVTTPLPIVAVLGIYVV